MIFNYINSKISQLIIHKIGNKINGDSYALSDSPVKEYPKEKEYLLINYFLSPFKKEEFYSFWHESQLDLNTCYTYAKAIFKNKNQFISYSQKIAKHLYEVTTHPNIKDGDLYICLFENCIFGDEVTNAIGIFKSESKNNYIQTYESNNHFEIKIEEGINLENLDKGCLIFNTNTNGSNGYILGIIDNLNKSNDTRYWKDNFLKVINLADNYYNTKKILTTAKSYVTSQISEEFNLDKTDKIGLLNRSIGYFKNHDFFDKAQFEKEVFQRPDIIESFRHYNSDLEINDFQISKQAVKSQNRFFKNVLRLDKNFHIYIHGDKQLIEKGYDEKKKMNYYKVYFREEQ